MGGESISIPKVLILLISTSPLVTFGLLLDNRDGPTWVAKFQQSKIDLKMNQKADINLTINYIDPMWGDNFTLHVISEYPDLATVEKTVRATDIDMNLHSWTGNFTVTALFLGRNRVFVELHRPNVKVESSRESMQIVISRNVTPLDNAFTIFIALFVTVIYVNFGAALDLSVLKEILIRPIGPSIGFVGQYLIMPILSFLIGIVLFPDMIELRLGLFFTGTSPGGGMSNIFTVILNGNLNLSIVMTAVSNLVAVGIMPMWIFTLGALIFHDGHFAIPYGKIAMFSVSLVVPLGIGIALQKCSPNMAKKLTRSLKPISIGLFLFITIFATSVNSFLFKLFSWKITIAAMSLPWLGYLLGWVLALILGQSSRDALTIGIETGIQNTGIAIFMLNFTLTQSQADMTSVVPVACAMMTPIPLIVIYLIRKYVIWQNNNDGDEEKEVCSEADIKNVDLNQKFAKVTVR